MLVKYIYQTRRARKKYNLCVSKILVFEKLMINFNFLFIYFRNNKYCQQYYPNSDIKVSKLVLGFF